MRLPTGLRRGVLRVLALVPVLASLSVVGTVVSVGPSATGCAQAASVHHAALVVEHGDGTLAMVCAAFSADSITGEQLLALSRVEYATAAYGGGTGDAVCQVGNEPAQYPPSCWTASSPYWAMYVSRAGGPWTFSTLGVSSQTFHDGDAEGFRYEAQNSSAAPPSPRGVCPVATPPVPAAVATAAPAAHPATLPTHRPAAAPRRPLTAATPTASPSAPPPPSGEAQTSSVTPSPSRPLTVIAAAPASAPSPPGSMSGAGWGAAAFATLLVALAAVRAVGRRGGRSHDEAAQPRR